MQCVGTSATLAGGGSFSGLFASKHVVNIFCFVLRSGKVAPMKNMRILPMTVYWMTVLSFFFVNSGHAAEEGGHHLPHNHIAVIVGYAEEEQKDGHYEEGKLFGFDYIRQFHEHWAWGLTLEQEGFGDNKQKRHGIFAVPVSYFINPRWRIFAAPGHRVS